MGVVLSGVGLGYATVVWCEGRLGKSRGVGVGGCEGGMRGKGDGWEGGGKDVVLATNTLHCRRAEIPTWLIGTIS